MAKLFRVTLTYGADRKVKFTCCAENSRQLIDTYMKEPGWCAIDVEEVDHLAEWTAQMDKAQAIQSLADRLFEIHITNGRGQLAPREKLIAEITQRLDLAEELSKIALEIRTIAQYPLCQPGKMDVFTLMNAMEQLGFRTHPNAFETSPSAYQKFSEFINDWFSKHD